MDGPRPAAAPGSRDQLVRRAASGDVAAFARIIRLHHEAMTRTAFVVTGDLDRAAAATARVLQDAWLGLRRPRLPEGLEAWLCSRAVVEAVRIERLATDQETVADLPVTHPPMPMAPGTLVAPLGALALEDRATLAMHHVAGLSAADMAPTLHRPKVHVERRLAWLVRRFPASLVRAAVDVPVAPIDADAIARRARAEEVLERRRVVSVAISAVVGFVVAAHPYLIAVLFRR